MRAGARGVRYALDMSPRATGTRGRPVVDLPTAPPEGSVLDVGVDDGGDVPSQDEHQRLEAVLDRAVAQAANGALVDAVEVLSRLVGTAR